MLYTVVLLGLAALAISYTIRYAVARQQRQALERRMGCQPIPRWPSVDPLGRDYQRIVKESWRTGRFNRTAMEQYEKVGSGTYCIESVGDVSVSTMEPLNHQAVVTRTDDWGKDVRKGSAPLMGRNNISSTEGAAWRRIRDLVTPLFQRSEIRDVEFFEKYVDRFIARLPRDADTTVDLQPLSRKLFLDSATEFCFGESIDSLRDNENSQADDFIDAFNRAVAGSGKRILPTGWRQTWENIAGAWDTKWLADCKVVHDYVDSCIARYRSREKPTSSTTAAKRYVLLEGMSAAISDPVQLRFQLLSIFQNGRETIAMAFSNIMFLLARNPHVWAKLRAQSLALAPDELTFERLNKLQYFKYTVNEAFRLHTPVPRIRRVARRDAVLPLGGGCDGTAPCLVPKGTSIWIDRYPKFFDPAIWGADVDAFRPERFEGRQLGWEFHPFSGGPRVCPAQQQVVSQLVYLLVRLTREFEAIENRDPCFEFIEGVIMCLESKNGCKVALRRAQAS